MKCRFCQTELCQVLVDLTSAPPSNSFLSLEELNMPEIFYPLKVYVCDSCFLVQLEEFKTFDSIFNNSYVYFSSYSISWLEHARRYTHMMVDRFGFSENSQVIEIASNDGYLLQFFKELNIPVLGIEPTKNTAEVARAKGIESINDFFGRKLATELVKINIKADLLLGNNVLAHVPDIVDFVSGMKLVLKDDGVITMEFPHLLQMIEHNEFDTIYHEHFSYLSFYTTKKIFESQGLELFDVEEIPTHGGSLRIYAKHKEDTTKAISENVTVLLKKELTKGINTLQYYLGFQHRVLEVKHKFIDFIVEKKLEGKKIAAYGAAAKGNTLINFCGLKSNEIDFVVDANPHKQNKWLPGSHIPVVSEENLWKEKPDYVVILPWNLKQEIVKKISYTRAWGCKFVTAIPMLEIFEAVAIGL